MAAELKDQGNASFKAGDFQAAVDAYTRALELDPQQHLCFSNRSAAYVKLGCKASEGKAELLEKALDDANRCVEMNPTWTKGYSRQAAALQELKRWDEAVAACQKGLEVNHDTALEKMRAEVLSRQFQSKLMGTWHGTVHETLGGYDQEMEFMDESSVRVAVLGRSIVGRYWVDTSHQPHHLNIQVPMMEAPPGMPPPPPVPYITKIDDAGLHICCPFMTMDRPTEFEGPGYCVMKAGAANAGNEGSETASLSHEEKLLECTKDLIKALPSRKLEDVQQTDSEEATRDKLMAQVRFESSMYAVQKKFGEEVMKEVLGATKGKGQVPAALAGTKELEELESKLSACGILEMGQEASTPEPPAAPAKQAEATKPAAPKAAAPEAEAPGKASAASASDREAGIASASGSTMQVVGVLCVGAAVAAMAFMLWRRQRR